MTKSRKKKEPSKNYFTQETKDAIVRYNDTDNVDEKNRIYTKYIHYPFWKLAQNWIHKSKIYHTNDTSIEDIQHTIVVYLLSKLPLYKPEQGDAFGYFNLICRNEAWNINKKAYKRKINTLSLEEINDSTEGIVDSLNSDDIIDELYNNSIKTEIDQKSSYELIGLGEDDFGETSSDKLEHFIDYYIEYCDSNADLIFDKLSQIEIAKALMHVFRQRGKLDFLNKKSVYLYVRETLMKEVKSTRITEVVKKLKTIFVQEYKYYLKHNRYRNEPYL